MGTNFYRDLNQKDLDDPKNHIGKRSAAGSFCWDCRISLCKGKVHHTDDYYDKCPKCGKPYIYDPKSNSAMIELGFEKDIKNKSGVSSCSSFTWATPPYELNCEFVYDEYKNKYTILEFKEMLKSLCPLEFFDSVGEWFS